MKTTILINCVVILDLSQYHAGSEGGSPGIVNDYDYKWLTTVWIGEFGRLLHLRKFKTKSADFPKGCQCQSFVICGCQIHITVVFLLIPHSCLDGTRSCHSFANVFIAPASGKVGVEKGKNNLQSYTESAIDLTNWMSKLSQIVEKPIRRIKSS